MCVVGIGQAMALQEMEIAIAAIVHTYDFKLAEGCDVKEVLEITLKPMYITPLCLFLALCYMCLVAHSRKRWLCLKWDVNALYSQVTTSCWPWALRSSMFYDKSIAGRARRADALGEADARPSTGSAHGQ